VLLGQKMLRRDPIAWIFFLIACGITVVIERELTALFLVAGALGAIFFAPTTIPPAPARPPAEMPKGGSLSLALPTFASFTGSLTTLSARIFLFFFKSGLLVFGSGLVIVPFLKTYIVDQYHWLNNQQFLDSVAIGMISPGPVVITATFVGFILDGLPGATAATVGMFAPAVLLTVLATPLILRYGRNRRLRGFIRGITVAVVGVLVGTTWLVAKSAISDSVTVAITVVSLSVLFLWKRAPEPLLVALGATIGLLAHRT
jgi:chromate transporter